jgi:hypothetical protein
MYHLFMLSLLTPSVSVLQARRTASPWVTCTAWSLNARCQLEPFQSYCCCWPLFLAAAGEMYRLTLGDLYRLEFERTLPAQQYAPPGRSKLQQDVLRMADVECAQQLQLWTIAALCRCVLAVLGMVALLAGT